MSPRLASMVVTLAGFMAATLVSAAGATVTPADSQLWINHCLPLPHEITIGGSVAVAPSDLRLSLAPDAGVAELQAVSDMAEWLKSQTGVAPTGAAFEIMIGVLDAKGNFNGLPAEMAARLKSLPNREQAYLICPQGENKLVVAGLTGKGVYYGVQTLRQLLEAKLTRTTITVPLATVIDWPDLEERGIWNSAQVVPWMASLKLNFCTYICERSWDTNGWVRARLDPKVMDLFKRHAMVERAQISHLNYWGHNHPGLYKLYPELKGQGDKATPSGEAFKFGGRDIANICASQPRWKSIVARVLSDLGAPPAPEVSVWLSEFEGQCQCAECLKSTQVQLESKMVVAAWQAARQQYPDLKLRIFFSQGDATPATAQALADLPPEVKIERVYGISKPFLDAAQKGQWVLSFSGYDCIASPDNCFRIPDVIRGPITNGYAARLKGVLSISYHYYGDGQFPAGYYPVVYSFPASALAEWSWNVNGRTPRQFMEAWATRAGYQQPARFADWVEVMTAAHPPVSPYGGGLSLPNVKGYRNKFAKIGESIRARRPIGLYATQELAQAAARCQAALALAEQLNQPAPLTETRYFMALLTMHAKLNELSDAIAGLDLSQPAKAAKVQEAWTTYQAAVAAALAANAKRIELWRAEPADYVEKAQKEINAQWLVVQQAMAEALAEILKSPPAK